MTILKFASVSEGVLMMSMISGCVETSSTVSYERSHYMHSVRTCGCISLR